jgi:signal transduction histidine kinase
MTHNTLPASEDARPRGRWLAVARVAWVVIALVDLVLFVASVPAYWDQLNTICADPSGATCNFTQLNLIKLQALERLGATIETYAAYTLTIHVAASLVFFVVGVLIFWRRSSDWQGLFVSLLLINFGMIGPSGVFSDALTWAYPEIAPLDDAQTLIFPALGLFLVTFPDGRFVPRWSWVIVLLWVVQAIFWYAIDSWPPPLFVAELLLVWGSTLAVQVYRYLRVANTTQRQQTKWVLFGFALGISTIVIEGILTVVFPQFNEPDSRFWLLEGTWVALLFTPIPLSIGIAILRYRLWDIDPIINRTLVYGALTVAVVAIYVLVVGYLGALFRTGSNLFISLLATGVVAVLFQPLRDRLQRGVNHLMYGERDEPYKVLSRLESTLTPDAVLPTVVKTVAEALKLPYAAIELNRDGAFETAAATGRPVDDPLRLPLVYGGETVGRLALGARSGSEDFTPADRRLLDDLVHQVGVAVHAVRLTDEALRLSADLQRSRERLVTAREEERRRLRRDLHDGLGPQLASLTMKAEAARDLLPNDSARADTLLGDLIEQMQTAVADVRRLVYALRPPALDALGLLGAIRSHAAHYDNGGLRIVIEAPEELPPLPAAVEVAAYRIVIEALNNILRHADARNCTVRLALDETAYTLCLEVTDDGRGIGEDRGTGVGLSSMRERAAELGGSCEIEGASSGGTHVLAHLPCTRAEAVEDEATEPNLQET